MKLLLAGGCMRVARTLDRDHEPLYREARLVELDTDTGALDLRLRWRSPADRWDPETIGHCFKGARWDRGRLLLCTEREVLRVAPATFAVEEVLTHRWFNDLHDVARLDGQLHVVSTGLDGVLVLDDTGGVVHAHGVMEGPFRGEKDVDYRARSTKPHVSHPNHVFEADGRVWVTRFHQCDAVALGAPARSIRLPGAAPHDGLVVGDRVWFTTVDGRLVEADPRSGQATRTLALDRDEDQPLGWCRGLFIRDDVAWVGFSRLRATRTRENLARIRGWLRGHQVATRLPTRIAAYNLSTRRIEAEWSTEDIGLHAIFAVLPAVG